MQVAWQCNVLEVKNVNEDYFCASWSLHGRQVIGIRYHAYVFGRFKKCRVGLTKGRVKIYFAPLWGNVC